MRELTPLELLAVAGGIQMVPNPRPRVDLRRLILAIIRRILDPRPRPVPAPER